MLFTTSACSEKIDIILATAFASKHLLEEGSQVQGFLRLVLEQDVLSFVNCQGQLGVFNSIWTGSR